MCRLAVPLRPKFLTIAMTALLAMIVHAWGQDQMVLGARQFEVDKTGNGAVLCTWSVYLLIQAETAACGLTRRPADDAMDQAIVAIDEFILANSSLRPTRAALEDFKRRSAESDIAAARRRGLQAHCSRPDLERFRSISPDQNQGIGQEASRCSARAGHESLPVNSGLWRETSGHVPIIEQYIRCNFASSPGLSR